jgi:DNA anti-recombination protein RmuC
MLDIDFFKYVLEQTFIVVLLIYILSKLFGVWKSERDYNKELFNKIESLQNYSGETLRAANTAISEIANSVTNMNNNFANQISRIDASLDNSKEQIKSHINQQISELREKVERTIREESK